MTPPHAAEVPGRRVEAGLDVDSEGRPRRFTLKLGTEVVSLDAGHTWVQVDHFKWVTRGLIEGPQGFRVLADGTVEINGEKIRPPEGEACARLENEINKHHDVARPRKAAAPPTAAGPTGPGKVRFKVRLDQLGHLMVECLRHEERTDTGLRGLGGFIENGLMLRPKAMHVHPLQLWIEMDGVRYECSEAGARRLEAALNEHYAPALSGEQAAIEIRENPAAATGFDIRFVTIRAGAKFETKGHLNQERLDILQDPAHCDLLQPGIVLRLSPPNLIVRRKRSDGGEERLPEIPDVQYRRIHATQLEELLNHPLIRRGGVLPPAGGNQPTAASPTGEVRRDRGGANPVPVASAPAGAIPPRVTELVEPSLGSVATGVAPAGTVVPLGGAGAASGFRPAAEAEAHLFARPVHPWERLFITEHPLRITQEVFQRLGPRFGVRVQEVALTLPRVFENRRFAVVSFSHPEIESILDLRGGTFFGFYLAYISEQRIDFVYACNGRHIEWGTDKCVVQSAVGAEAAEFKGSALLGMAQDSDQSFAFIVTPEYKRWIAPHERAYAEVCAQFIGVPDLLAASDRYQLIYPEAPAAAA